ncbi:unnamed protein product [Cyclocybe aegerita]|uniref:NAD(P)-binding domain-containing protein n=1 Tax=Cyclocybe aegerita TaxID=1973307 RepID=A0A8S0WPF3_CYCAE|nr:unnamed protein product [Cyclocybe aegerita]
MRLFILGATGPSGIELVRRAFQVHPDCTIVVYVRSPNKLPDDIQKNPSVTIVKGNLDELDKVDQALEGVDAVLSALGPIPGQVGIKPIATFYGHLIDLLYKHNIKRFIPTSTASFPAPEDKRNWKFSLIVGMVHTFMKDMYNEVVEIGRVVTTKGADLDYTIVRVAVLTNADSDAVAAGYIGDPRIGLMLARKAYAAFCIDELEKRRWVKKVPAISNA